MHYENGDKDSPASHPQSQAKPGSPSSPTSPNSIVHRVSKFDTLAGVAIKYGVEVSDVKRLNGLMTDYQMFALKTIQIPLSGRHPPPSFCNGHDIHPLRTRGSELSSMHRSHSDFFDKFQSLRAKSPSERKLHALRQMDQRAISEGFEMAMHQYGVAHAHDGLNQPLNHPRRSKSIASFLLSVNPDVLDSISSQELDCNGIDRSIERMVRRRQKSVPDFSLYPPEKVLKEENNNGTAVSPLTGKTVAMRSKLGNRVLTTGGANSETDASSPNPTGLGDSSVNNSVNGLRRSTSVSSFQDSDTNPLSSIWPASMWNLKPDFQAISSAAIPIFDGLHKPTARRNKAAID